MSAPPPDRDARAAIRDDLGTTILVEAAAGTGKTTSLVERMVNLVRTGNGRAANLAAITFTVKAAGHLRERFHEALEHARDAETGEQLRRVEEALAEIDRGFIGTTHAFCARLLRERPVEAGLDPDFEELDAVAMTMATRSFWERWYEAQGEARPQLLAKAGSVQLDARLLRAAFETAVNHADITLVSQPIPAPDLGSVCREICDLLDECEPHMPVDPPDPDAFVKMLTTLLRRRRSSDLTELAAQLTFLGEADHASHRPVQKRWPDGPTARRLFETYSAFVQSTLRPRLREWREHVHGVALDLLKPAVAEFAEERIAGGTLSFQDLLVCARNLLRDHPRVRAYFQRRFTHLLVDEFQDTDPLQTEIVFYLTGHETSERDWKKLTPRPGSLFIVGDPKQSIYRFRRADITTYLTVRRRIEATGGRVVHLTTNFRSAEQVCSFVNGAFGELFAPEEVEKGRQAAHVPLHPHRAVAPPHGVFGLETQDARTAAATAAQEAECVATWIRDAVNGGLTVDDGGEVRPCRWNDFLLVTWYRPRLSHYARALESLGIPYVVTGSRAFDDAPQLVALLPLLRAVVDPEDDVSIVAFLRGPLCGVDDDALYRFRLSGGSFSPFVTAVDGTDEGITGGLQLVREAIEDARALPAGAAIARIVERTAAVPLAASGERGGTRSGTLLLAVAMAREASARGESFASILAMLEDLTSTQAEIEELDVDPASENAVRLMNLHQVKGLEAPIVFLVDPWDGRDWPVDLVVDRSGDESLGHLAVLDRKTKGDPVAVALPPRWETLSAEERLFVEAEKRRLLYVAATRAKNILVVGFRRTAKGIAGAWRELAVRVQERLFAAPPPVTADSSAASLTQQFAAAQVEIAGRLTRAEAATYSVLPVTKLAHDGHEQLVRDEEGLGRGTSWGRVLHRLFEAMLRDEQLDVRLHAANLLKDEERDPVELADVVEAVEALRSSPLWARVKDADEKYAEVPFALTVAKGDVGLEGEGTTLLHGTVDLVFREGGRWIVVDYKSDRTANRLEPLVKYYAPQVRHYANFWQQLTGKPTEAGLFFVDGAIERWV